MADQKETIYDSPTSEPDDEFWLKQGKKLVEGSLSAVQDAAKSLMTGLVLLKGIYLGILSFANYIPKETHLFHKSLFILPLVLWLAALYSCLQVMMTKRMDINLHSPGNIQIKSEKLLLKKQGSLQWGYWLLTIGLLLALMLLIFRLNFSFF